MYIYTHTHTLGAALVPLTITVCGTLHCEFSQNSSAPDPCCLYAHDKYPPHLLYLQICCIYTCGEGGGDLPSRIRRCCPSAMHIFSF